MNILHLFDTSGDNSISLEEFERQMSKFMGGTAIGRIEVPTADKIESKIIPEAMKKELAADLAKEAKQKANFEDFGFKNVSVNDNKLKEQKIIEDLKNGSLVPEMICGELKLQF